MNFLSRMRRPKIDISEIEMERDLPDPGDPTSRCTLSLHGVVIGYYYVSNIGENFVAARGGDSDMNRVLVAWATEFEREERAKRAKERKRMQAERAADAAAMWDEIERAKR